MEIKKIKLSQIHPNPNNPRVLKDDKFKALVKSLTDFPEMMEIREIVVDETMTILGGNMRYRALKEIGAKECIVKIVSGLTDEQKQEFIVKDNLSFGEWDFDMLANSFEQEKLVEWGMDLPIDFNEVLEAKEDDYEIPDEIKTDIVLGDLFEIGQHRLLCGDSTNSDDVAKLMNGELSDMIFTDPPYGIDYSGERIQVVEKKTYGKLMNDDLQGVELGELISNIFLFNKKEADVYICVSPIMQKPFLDFIQNSNKEIDAVIVWDKKQPGLGYMSYRRQCEFILFIKGKAFKKGDISDFDLWSISRDNGKDYVHGTQKPIAVPSRAINNSSKKDDLVLDYFLGSGSTMVAAHQLNRKCYGMELDPKYCQVIIDRMIKLDSTLIIKKNGKPYKAI